jgi:hypothetical protein
MITPERVAITIMATLAPLIPIAVTDTVPVPVPVPILGAVMATEAQADTVFTHANANLSGRWQSHRQDRGAHQTVNEFVHFNLLWTISQH